MSKTTPGLHPLARTAQLLRHPDGRPYVDRRGRFVYIPQGAAETFETLLAGIAAGDELTAEQTQALADLIAAAETVDDTNTMVAAIGAAVGTIAADAPDTTVDVLAGVLDQVNERATAIVAAGGDTEGADNADTAAATAADAARTSAISELEAAVAASTRTVPVTAPAADSQGVQPVAAAGRPAARTQEQARLRTRESLRAATRQQFGLAPEATDERGDERAFLMAAGQKFASMLDASRAAMGGGTKLNVNSLRGNHVLVSRVYDDTEVDGRFDTSRATEKDWDEAMRSFVKRRQSGRAARGQNLTAAGGVSGPPMILRQISVIGSTFRPLLADNPVIVAEAGAISSRIAPILPNAGTVGSLGEGIATYTAAQDAANVTKALSTYNLPASVITTLTAVYERLQVGNLASTLDPEGLAAAMEIMDIVAARLLEQAQFARMQAMAKATRIVQQYSGALPDIMSGFIATTSELAWRERMDRRDMTFQAVIPIQMADAIATDIFRAKSYTAGGASSVSDEQIAEWFKAQDIMPTWFWDLPNAFPAPEFAGSPAGAATANTRLPATVPVVIYPEGGIAFPVGPEIKMGLFRDSVTNAQNNGQTFFETMETAIQRCPEVAAMSYQFQPNGGRAGDVAIAGYNAGTQDSSRTPAAVG